MFYKIFGRKIGKAFCYPIENVQINGDVVYFYDPQTNDCHFCVISEIIENPTFTGRTLGDFLREIFLPSKTK